MQPSASLQDQATETRRAFGFVFICISIAVGAGTVLSKIAYLNRLPVYYYAIIWIGSFDAVFGASVAKSRKVAPMIRGRMNTSVTWSAGSKALNGIC